MAYSIRKVYDAELLALDSMLAKMGHAAGNAIANAMQALKTGDLELARTVIARDSEINSTEHEVEHRCLTLILRQQPVATDLRKVSTALKMVSMNLPEGVVVSMASFLDTNSTPLLVRRSTNSRRSRVFRAKRLIASTITVSP